MDNGNLEERKDEEEKKNGSVNQAFECSICMELPTNPVATQCGHLFCWYCMHNWLEQNMSTLVCPVCKAGVSRDSLIPLFTKGASQKDPRNLENELPKRPGAQRMNPVPNQNYQGNSGRLNNTFAFGLLPTANYKLIKNFREIFSGDNGDSMLNETNRKMSANRTIFIYIIILILGIILMGRDSFFYALIP